MSHKIQNICVYIYIYIYIYIFFFYAIYLDGNISPHTENILHN